MSKAALKCPACGVKLSVSSPRKKFRCPKCQEVIERPGPDSDDALPGVPLEEERSSPGAEQVVLKRQRTDYALALPTTDADSAPRGSGSKGFPPKLVGVIGLAVVAVVAIIYMGQGSDSPSAARNDTPAASGSENPFAHRAVPVPQVSPQGTVPQGTVPQATAARGTSSISPAQAASRGSSAAETEDSGDAKKGDPDSRQPQRMARELKTNAIALITAEAEEFKIIELSPDGNVLATATGPAKTVEIWEAKTGRRWGAVSLTKGSAEQAAFTLDGRLVAITDSEGFLSVYDVLSGKRLKYFQVATGSVATLGLSLDGNLALTGIADHAPSLWNVVTSKRIGVDRADAGCPTAFAIAPRLGLVVAANDRGLVQSLDFRTGRALRTLPVVMRPVRSIAFSHAEKWVVVGTDAGLWGGMVSTGTVQKMEGSEQYGPVAFFAGDESFIVMKPPKLEVWDIETRWQTESVELEPAWHGRQGALSGDGSIVVRPIGPALLEVREIPLAKGRK